MDILKMKHREDIRYRGILTYRGLRFFALIMMTLSQYSTVLLFANKAANALGEYILPEYAIKIMTALKPMGQITFPLLLIASFAIVLNGAESFKRMLISYFIMAAVTYLSIVLLLSNFLNIMIHSLPDALPLLAKDFHLDQVPGALIERLLSTVLPGDGMLHLEELNGLLHGIGIKFDLPTQQQIVELLTSFGLEKDMIDDLLALVTSLNSAELVQEIQAYVTYFIKAANVNIAAYLNSYAIPIISTRINAALNINVYWDLFLYTLCYFFIKYNPKGMHGGKRMLFRCCALFPASWMILSVMISGNLRMLTSIQCPVWFTALMGRGNLSALMLFFLLVLFEKFRELEFKEHNDGSVSWTTYRNGKKSSLQFSIYTSIVLGVVSLFDYLLSMLPTLSLWGLGKSYHMWIAAPVLMLFSYNKKPRFKIFNAVITIHYVLHYGGLVLLCSTILMLGVQLVTGIAF